MGEREPPGGAVGGGADRGTEDGQSDRTDGAHDGPWPQGAAARRRRGRVTGVRQDDEAPRGVRSDRSDVRLSARRPPVAPGQHAITLPSGKCTFRNAFARGSTCSFTVPERVPTAMAPDPVPRRGPQQQRHQNQGAGQRAPGAGVQARGRIKPGQYALARPARRPPGPPPSGGRPAFRVAVAPGRSPGGRPARNGSHGPDDRHAAGRRHQGRGRIEASPRSGPHRGAAGAGAGRRPAASGAVGLARWCRRRGDRGRRRTSTGRWPARPAASPDGGVGAALRRADDGGPEGPRRGAASPPGRRRATAAGDPPPGHRRAR